MRTLKTLVQVNPGQLGGSQAPGDFAKTPAHVGFCVAADGQIYYVGQPAGVLYAVYGAGEMPVFGFVINDEPVMMVDAMVISNN